MASKIELCDEIRALKAERDRLREDNERLRGCAEHHESWSNTWRERAEGEASRLRTAREALDVSKRLWNLLESVDFDSHEELSLKYCKDHNAAIVQALDDLGDALRDLDAVPDPVTPSDDSASVGVRLPKPDKAAQDASCPGCAAGRQMLADLCDTASSHVHDECACSGMPDYECSYCELRAAVQAGYDALAQMKGGSDD